VKRKRIRITSGVLHVNADRDQFPQDRHHWIAWDANGDLIAVHVATPATKVPDEIIIALNRYFSDPKLLVPEKLEKWFPDVVIAERRRQARNAAKKLDDLLVRQRYEELGGRIRGNIKRIAAEFDVDRTAISKSLKKTEQK
jgi:hypothetical protein